MWRLNTGAQKAILARGSVNKKAVIANTISFTDHSLDDSGSGLGDFKAGDFIHVIDPAGGVNHNVYAQCITASASSIVFPAGTFSSLAAGSYLCIETFSAGAFAEVFKNGILVLRDSTIPADADQAETGTPLVQFTKGGLPFNAGVPTNGLSLGQMIGTTLKRAIDPATGQTEEWTGVGLANGSAVWGRFYDNDFITGASTTAIRMDGLVSTGSSGDIIMTAGNTISIDTPAIVTDVTIVTQMASCN